LFLLSRNSEIKQFPVLFTNLVDRQKIMDDLLRFREAGHVGSDKRAAGAGVRLAKSLKVKFDLA
jgi:hypothetical protein